MHPRTPRHLALQQNSQTLGTTTLSAASYYDERRIFSYLVSRRLPYSLQRWIEQAVERTNSIYLFVKKQLVIPFDIHRTEVFVKYFSAVYVKNVSEVLFTNRQHYFHAVQGAAQAMGHLQCPTYTLQYKINNITLEGFNFDHLKLSKKFCGFVTMSHRIS